MTLRVCTFNLSVAAAKHHPTVLCQQLANIMRDHDAVLMQEAGQAHAVVVAAAKAAGHVPYFGDGLPGQSSTPVSVRRDLAPTFDAVQLSGRRKVGRGAGPDVAKAKHLLTATFRIDGATVTVGNVHAYASQQNKPRALAAILQFTRALSALSKHDGALFIGGDLNAVPGARTLAAFRRRLRSTQRRLGQIGTHGKRAIDDVYFDPRKCKPVERRAIHTVSDHKALSVTFKTFKETR